jgi:hypothetical protein
MAVMKLVFFVTVFDTGRCVTLMVIRFGLVLSGGCWLGLVIGCDA